MTIDTWFGDPASPTLGFLHVPAQGRARGAVVICPPLGHEHVIGYRGMRLLGQELADRGLAALRFDYVGEGDASGASAAADSVERWLASIENAVAYVRASGIDEVALVGLTSGALLAAESLGRLSGIAGLVLWDPTISGRRFVRREKSIYDMTVQGDDVVAEGRVPLLSLALHTNAADWLDGAEITGADLAASGVETLLLGRRANEANSATVKLLASLPPTVEYRPIEGQEEFLDVASSIAVIPQDTITSIADWLSVRFSDTTAKVTPTVTTVATVGVSAGGTPIIEKIGRFGSERIFTVETVLDDEVPAIERGLVAMQPAAAEHRTGPARFQVIAARDLASRGYRALRFDRRITGETTAVVATEPNMVIVKEWIDDAAPLVTATAGGAPVALVGLCSGAWVSARIAETTKARLTVLLGINYYRTKPYLPGHYANQVRAESRGAPPAQSLRDRVRMQVPGWLWRLVSRAQVFNDPSLLLTPLSTLPDSTVALLLSPEDTEVLERNRGVETVARLRKRGADIRVTSYGFGDHALFGEGIRSTMLTEIVELVESTIPAVPESVLRS